MVNQNGVIIALFQLICTQTPHDCTDDSKIKKDREMREISG